MFYFFSKLGLGCSEQYVICVAEIFMNFNDQVQVCQLPLVLGMRFLFM